MLLLHPSPSGSWLGGSSPIRLGSLSLPTRKPSPVSPMSSEKPYLQLTHWIFWDRLSSPQFLKAKTLACETSEPACFTESKAVTSCDKSSDTSDTSVGDTSQQLWVTLVSLGDTLVRGDTNSLKLQHTTAGCIVL